MSAGILARRITFILIACLAFTLPATVDDFALKENIPWFIIVLCLQLAPVLWFREVDLGSPLVSGGVTGLLAAVATSGTLLAFINNGRLDLPWLGNLDSGKMSALAKRVLFAHILSTVVYYLGYQSRGLRTQFLKYFPKGLIAGWNRQRFFFVSVMGFVVFIVCYTYFQLHSGVSMLDPTQLKAGKQIWREDATLSWMLRGVQMGMLPASLLLVEGIRRKGVAFLIGSSVVTLGVAYLILRMGQRGMFFYFLLYMMLLVHYLRQRIPISAFVVMLLLAISLSNILLIWRQNDQAAGDMSAVSDQIGSSSSFVDQATTSLAQYENDRQHFLVNALIFNEFPDNRNFLMGQSWLAILAAPIPRWLWPEKSSYFTWREAGIVYQLVGSPNPTPLLGLAYANFSWVGVVVIFFLWGAFHRNVYEWLQIASGDPNRVLLYVAVLLFLSPTVVGVSNSLQSILPLWLVLRFLSPKGPVKNQTTKLAAS